jgi:hypothetical protein
MKCPYCQDNNMPKPPASPRPFGECPNCGRKSRAAVSCGSDGTIYVHYSATGRPKTDENSLKKTFSVKLSKDDIKSMELGMKELVVCNNSLRLQYKT